MAVLEIIKFPDHLLRTVSKPVAVVDDEVKALIDDMLETMYHAAGIGLAAIQVGVQKRLVVMDIPDCAELELERSARADDFPDDDGQDDSSVNNDNDSQSDAVPDNRQPQTPSEVERERHPSFLINPEIVWRSKEVASYQEGCLSIPDYIDEVERPASCLVKYLDRDGSPQEMLAEGLQAVCVQHEVDHLNGILFVDHLSRLKREMFISKYRKETKQAIA